MVKCLDSVCAQTLKDIEIICVDDGSTDDSIDILNEYKNKDNRIVVVRQENQGQGAARQKGIEHSKGDFIGFVDNDDTILPNMYEKLYNQAIELGSDIVECGFDAILDWNKKVVKVYNFDDYNIKLTNIKIKEKTNYSYEDLEDILIGTLSPTLWHKIFKRKFIEDNEIKSPTNIRTLGEDVVLYLDIMLKAPKISFIHESFYKYLIQPTSCLRTWNVIRQLEDFRQNLYKVLKQNNRYTEKLKKQADDYIMSFYVEYSDGDSSKAKKENYKYIMKTLDEREYQQFLLLKKEHDKKNKRTILNNIFSVRNTVKNAIVRKEIRLFGFKISFKKKKVEN